MKPDNDVQALVVRFSEGESLRAVCRDAGMPSVGTVRGWAREDREGFAEHYRQARLLQLDYWADEIIDIADQANLDPRDGQVRIDTRKWSMSKLAPRRFGDRLLHAVDPEAPIRHEVDLGRLSIAELDALEQFASALIEAKGS